MALPLALGSLAASACINTYSFDLKSLLSAGEKERAHGLALDIEARHRKSPTPENTNDLAVVRILAGRYDEAIQMLRTLEATHPGKAITAANLGTALELAGDDTEALRWIREGYRRDPREHNGSEWVHVRILEAKLALARDPAWLAKNGVMRLDFGVDDAPRAPAKLPTDHTGRQRDLAATFAAINYQLFERTLFVAPPDAVVADLFMTCGDLAVLLAQGGAEPKSRRSVACYEKAIAYGYSDTGLVRRRQQSVSLRKP
jgi:tetratricopeptide (TPR) repeat protein